MSDNGPQFTATLFEGYLAEMGIRKALTTPFHPASNGQAERFVRIVKEALARLGLGDWQAKIDTFLAAQHVIPCMAIGQSLAKLLMGRKLHCMLDRLHPNYSRDTYKQADRKARGFLIGKPVFARNYSMVPYGKLAPSLKSLVPNRTQ